MSGREAKATPRSELMELAKVNAALDKAEEQIVAYRAALERSRGETLKLRSFSVAALGFERLVVRRSSLDGSRDQSSP